MRADSIAEVVQAFLCNKGVELPIPACGELAELVADLRAIPSFVEPEKTARMAPATLAHAVALSRLPA